MNLASASWRSCRGKTRSLSPSFKEPPSLCSTDSSTAKWIEDNQLINGDVYSPGFMYRIGREQYLNDLRGGEWGDQLALIGIANTMHLLFVAISIVPRLHVDTGIEYIYPQNNIVGQQWIFLGHEFETHYIRLVALYETEPMPQSDQWTVQDTTRGIRIFAMLRKMTSHVQIMLVLQMKSSLQIVSVSQ